ncbi:CDP-alcohol phosphatidyltransferase family protein [Pseudooceanicola sp. C21-150M6]|uniref:CDP-alcohol phosphatidyltransferase family protein n=1 Tax=Pseudooceanicola sp. C21-150M6 TaxID=3434355 RepID=UPI003D7F75FC
MLDTRLPSRRRGLRLTGAGTGPAVRGAVLACAIAGLVLVCLLRFMPGTGVPSGMAALLGFACAIAVAGVGFLRSYPHDRLGWCNAVTVLRLALVMSLVSPLLSGHGATWATLGVAVLALALDGVDGWLARREGLVSGFGARFDMEVDSALALVLSIGAAIEHQTLAILILLGLPRYLFLAASWLVPWLRRGLPERFSRKTVCVLQIAVLIALQIPVLPDAAALAMAGLAALAVAWSFAVDVVWLGRRRR